MSLPEKVNVTAIMSVITAGPQRILTIAGVKDVTCFVKAEQKLLGFPCLVGERGPQGPVGNAEWGGITGDINDQTDLGYMAQVDDAPSDGAEYVRKNGNWAVSSGGGGGGSASWGAITGTLSNQTDLQSALNAKANTADLGDLATQDTVDYTTEVTNKPTLGDLSALDSIDYTSAYLTNKPTLGTLASKDTADYATDLTNKPTLGALAGMDSISYSSNYLTDKPTLGTMASVNDAPSDNTEYARKNGQWVISSGGGGGGVWGAITGTLSNQTDLQTALNAKADVTDITLNVFSESESYSYGQLVIYQSLLYRFIDNHTAGPWDSSDVSRITVSDLLNLKADVQSPALTGTPTAPTPTAGNSSTKIATTAFVQGELDRQILYYTAQTVSAATSAQIMRIPASGTDSAITTDTVVLDINFANPGNITSAISWESFAGYITFTGTCTAATTANVVLGTKGN